MSGPTPSCVLRRAQPQRLTRFARLPVSVRAPEYVRHQRRLPRAGRAATCVAEREQQRREKERTGRGAARGQNPPHPPKSDKMRDGTFPHHLGTPAHCPLAPPSIGHALCPFHRHLLAVSHAPPRSSVPIDCCSTLSSRSFLLAQATPSHLSPVSAFSLGSSPNHLSFIVPLVLGAWDMGVNQTRPCSRGVKGMVGGHGPRLR